jgi:hypothetical protein
LEDLGAGRDGVGGRRSGTALVENVRFIGNFVGNDFISVVVVYSETLGVLNLKKKEEKERV